MAKTLRLIKIVLLIIFTGVITLFAIKAFISAKKNDMYSISYPFVITLILYVVYLSLSIYDSIKKKEYLNNKIYNIICIIGISVICLIFIRALFDPNFITSLKDLKSYYKIVYEDAYYYYFELNISYIESNTLYFIIIFGLLITYRFINFKKSTK